MQAELEDTFDVPPEDSFAVPPAQLEDAHEVPSIQHSPAAPSMQSSASKAPSQPMRSIIKTPGCDAKTDPKSENKAKQLKFSSDSKSREKKVRFDDMQTLGLGCGDSMMKKFETIPGTEIQIDTVSPGKNEWKSCWGPDLKSKFRIKWDTPVFIPS